MGTLRTGQILLSALITLSTPGICFSKDLGFRYRDGKCVNDRGVEGLNTAYLGQCSDLRNVIMARLALDEIDFSGSQFTNSDLQQSTFNKSILNGVNFDGANLAGVELNETKIQASSFKKINLKNIKIVDAEISKVDFSETNFSGSVLSYVKFQECTFTGANFSGSALDGSEFVGSQLSGVNFKGGKLAGARLEKATIDGADFSGVDLSGVSLRMARGNAVNFSNANMSRADLEKAVFIQANLRGARLDAAKLRGVDFQKSDMRSANLKDAQTDGAIWSEAIYNKRTVLPFTDDVARGFGMIFKKAPRLLIIWDEKSTYLDELIKALQAADVEVTLSSQVESSFTEVGLLNDADAVLHLNSRTYTAEMPVVGQNALVEFVSKGGIFVHMEWSSYELSQGRMKAMRDLILVDFGGSGGNNLLLTPVATQSTHPVLRGFSQPISVAVGGSTGQLHAFADQPAVVLMTGANNRSLVVARNFGTGHILGLGFTATFSGVSSLTNAGVQKLIINAANWE